MTSEEFSSARAHFGVSQDELAWRLGVSQSAVSKYEHGTCRVPADIAATLRRIDRSSMWPKRWTPLSDRLGKQRIRNTLIDCQWSVSLAAERLGLRIVSLHRYVNANLREEWLAADRPNRTLKHKHLYDRNRLIAEFSSCDWRLTATAKQLGIHKMSLRSIGYRVIPDLMKRNVYRRSSTQGHPWRSSIAASVAIARSWRREAA